jgi:hypothetical protein
MDPKSALLATRMRPGIERILVDPAFRVIPSTAPPPQPTPPPAPVAPAAPPLPAAPVTNPFAALPFRSPGDRIKSDDFNALARGLQIIGDAYVLAGALFGVAFAQARAQLAAQQYQIDRVMTVFGTEVSAQTDGSLDSRKVIQIVPTVLGERRVMIVVTEAVETRRLAPNLLGLTYADAVERQRAAFGEGTFPAVSMTAAPLVGRSLADAQALLNQ